MIANTRDECLGIELWLYDEKAKKHFANLLEQKTDIEAKLGFELDWQELPDARACRIAIRCPNVAIDDESRWAEYFNWFTQRVVKLDAVLRPIVKALP